MRKKATPAVDTATTISTEAITAEETQANEAHASTPEASPEAPAQVDYTQLSDEQRQAIRHSNVLAFHNKLYEICEAEQTKFTDSDEFIKANLRCNSCNMQVRSYKATGNTFITLYNGSEQIYNRQTYFDMDGKRIKDTINKFRKAWNIQELLNAPAI